MQTSPARSLVESDPDAKPASGTQARAPIARELADALAYEEDELTIRRDFTPRPPQRVEVEVSDADKTWKWTRPRADHAGRFVGLALPTLDDAHLARFEHDDVEATLEMASPFALQSRAAAIPLVTPTRPTRPLRPVASDTFDRTSELLAVMVRRPQVRAAAAFVLTAIVAVAIAFFAAR